MLVRCRGIAILELGGIVLIEDLDNLRALEDLDLFLASGTWETLAVDRPSPCPAMPAGTCGGISGIEIY
jgi:hypothetical protein